MSESLQDPTLEALVALGRGVRDRLRTGFVAATDRWSSPDRQGVSDLQYPLDTLSEDGLLAEIASLMPGDRPLRVQSEGLDGSGHVIRPGEGGDVLVLDPVDGTRGLTHDKRSAFFLAAVAPDGPSPKLSDVTHACMVELPPQRQSGSDVIVTAAAGPVRGWTEDLATGSERSLALQPSQSTDLRHGFATVNRFLWCDAEPLGRFQDTLVRALYPGDPDPGRDIFEDQYICNGGQLHGLMTGRDRFVADLRPLLARDGRPRLTSHPYDLLPALIATKVGVVLTGPTGDPLDTALDITTPVAWIGYASDALRRKVEPAVRSSLPVLEE